MTPKDEEVFFKNNHTKYEKHDEIKKKIDI